ncbi:SRPBCC domain-containing protein [Myxococcus sp. AM001]|nr:SRPBCC domain-containing protein [Myxococcus sp. AM001]
MNAALDLNELAKRQLKISRLISAPRALVFQAFTDAKMISNWWGPNGFRTTTVSKDVRPGGTWKFTMHGPDGTDFPNHIVYTKVVPNELLEWDHGSKEGEVMFKVVVTFKDEAGQTRVTLQHTMPTVEAREQAAKYAIEGGKQTLTRLEQHLATQQ